MIAKGKNPKDRRDNQNAKEVMQCIIHRQFRFSQHHPQVGWKVRFQPWGLLFLLLTEASGAVAVVVGLLFLFLVLLRLVRHRFRFRLIIFAITTIVGLVITAAVAVAVESVKCGPP